MNEMILYGTTVEQNRVPSVANPLVSFPGRSLTGQSGFGMDAGMLSRHLLLLGGSGCGKTNTFQFAMNQILPKLGKDDIAIVFDTKGEFYQMFHRPGDYVIGNSAEFQKKSHVWNIFDEVLADGWDDYCVTTNAREIAAALFHGRGSASQPFFCNAAKDIFMAVLLHFVRAARRDPAKWKPLLNNWDLRMAFARFKPSDYLSLFKIYSDLHYMETYIGDGKSNQALGVFGELNSMLSEYFVGILAGKDPDRSISMRNAVRQRGGKTIYIEYDLSVGESLTPVYRLLVDQALKEALGRTDAGNGKKHGSVYLFADEFKLLPKLQHIDDALNFGRGLGVRVMAGLQSVSQLYDIYGKDHGEVLASGFGSIFCYHTNDTASRTFVSELMGTNVVLYSYYNKFENREVVDQRQGKTVEIWTQINLGVGQAVISLGTNPPFLYQFDEYKHGGRA